jgi:hypothetical protein
MAHADQVDDETLAAELVARMDRDQQARTREPSDWDEVAAVDAENTAWLAAVLDRRGWPLQSQVGEQAASATSLISAVPRSGWGRSPTTNGT